MDCFSFYQERIAHFLNQWRNQDTATLPEKHRMRSIIFLTGITAQQSSLVAFMLFPVRYSALENKPLLLKADVQCNNI